MSPDKLAVALRPRNGWEAIDLGLQLARHCAKPLFGATAVVVLCTTLLGLGISALGDGDWNGWAWALVWWLKPLYDRVALHTLSRAVFGETTSLRQALAALPGLMRHSGLFAALTWRRLNPQRALRLPVDQLEGMRGKPARARRQLLGQRVGGNGMGLIFCCFSFETVVWVSLFGLVVLMAPEGTEVAPPLLRSLFSPGESGTLLGGAMFLFSYALSVILIEPFYVAGGFGLYIKRRTDLEAWDVEMQFRRLAQGGGALAAILLVGAVCLSTLLAPAPAHAAQTSAERREAAAQYAQTVIPEVLKAPEFGHADTHKRLRLRDQEQPKPDASAFSWLKPLFKFLASFGHLLAEAARTIAWVLLFLLGAGLIWLLLRHLVRLKATRRAPVLPTTLAGMDIRPDSLPADIGSAVQGLIAAGRLREALALLYRASLSRLAHRERIPFERGDTEGDCLLRVTRAQSPSRAYFAQLTRAWQNVAYARRELAAAEAELLCSDWQQTFAGSVA